MSHSWLDGFPCMFCATNVELWDGFTVSRKDKWLILRNTLHESGFRFQRTFIRKCSIQNRRDMANIFGYNKMWKCCNESGFVVFCSCELSHVFLCFCGLQEWRFIWFCSAIKLKADLVQGDWIFFLSMWIFTCFQVLLKQNLEVTPNMFMQAKRKMSICLIILPKKLILLRPGFIWLLKRAAADLFG